MLNFPKTEEEILEFWQKNKIFEKSLALRKEAREFVFYDGPPFATGLPHYGHLIAGTIKDVVPRYKTMRGFKVERRWGWDCHGLPVEYEVEKELGISGKRDIEEKIGIAEFNEKCRSIVLRYAKEWEKTVERSGRWVDMEHSYRTMDSDYMESIWWVFKTLWDKGLIYEGYKILPFCPRCSTPLSNFETNMPGAYKDVEDKAITVKLKVQPGQEKLDWITDKTFILIWTTTPWTLPSNSGAAVGPEIDYVLAEDLEDGNQYILAEARLNSYYRGEEEYRIIKRFKGRDLAQLKYEPLFPYFKDEPNAFRVVQAEFVSILEGTGIVHIAPAFGEDDFNLGQKEGLPVFAPVNELGKFTGEVKDYEGQFVKEADSKIIQDLKASGKIVKTETITHSYPHCWRCETPLIYKAVSSWFLAVTKIKDDIIKNNEKIYWMPEHLKYGRFGKWLEEARDYAFSRNRYWGNPLPIWRCQNNKEHIKIIGSIQELEMLWQKKIVDLHKHFIDDIAFACDTCGGLMKRVPEVLDCWLESGSMPYAQSHYPFENKEHFEKNFPAEFIAEGIDQTRGWFYTLLVISTALFNKPAFLNVVVNGLILAEDGKKMSKRLKNYPEPELIINKYGADALRIYLLESPAVHADSLCFSEKGVAEIQRKALLLLWNIFEFLKTYLSAEAAPSLESPKSKNILDKWILVKLNLLIKDMTQYMEKYDLAKAVRASIDFIQELSLWYVRRSRERFKRFKGGANKKDSKDSETALGTLSHVLATLIKLMAPFAPFLTEKIYQELVPVNLKKESIHLEDWPQADEKMINEKILKDMGTARQIVSQALEERAKTKIPIRQVLADMAIPKIKLAKEYLEIIKAEINVKEIKIGKEKEVQLNTKITPQLRREGFAREIIRQANALRKEAGLTINDTIILYCQTSRQDIKKAISECQKTIMSGALAAKIEAKKDKVEAEKEVKIGEASLWIGVSPVRKNGA